MSESEDRTCARCGAVINGGTHLRASFFDQWGRRPSLASKHRLTGFDMCDRCYFELCESLPYAQPKGTAVL